MGRPSKYSVIVADRICHELATTDKGIERILQAPEMPSSSMLYRWLESHADFREKYARAREQQADFLANQILAISDDGEADRITRQREDGSEYQAVDQEHIQRSRLRVDSRKWLASKLAPKKYGDRMVQEQVGAEGGPIQHRVIVHVVESDGNGRRKHGIPEDPASTT